MKDTIGEVEEVLLIRVASWNKNKAHLDVDKLVEDVENGITVLLRYCEDDIDTEHIHNRQVDMFEDK